MKQNDSADDILGLRDLWDGVRQQGPSFFEKLQTEEQASLSTMSTNPNWAVTRELRIPQTIAPSTQESQVAVLPDRKTVSFVHFLPKVTENNTILLKTCQEPFIVMHRQFRPEDVQEVIKAVKSKSIAVGLSWYDMPTYPILRIVISFFSNAWKSPLKQEVLPDIESANVQGFLTDVIEHGIFRLVVCYSSAGSSPFSTVDNMLIFSDEQKLYIHKITRKIAQYYLSISSEKRDYVTAGKQFLAEVPMDS